MFTLPSWFDYKRVQIKLLQSLSSRIIQIGNDECHSLRCLSAGILCFWIGKPSMPSMSQWPLLIQQLRTHLHPMSIGAICQHHCCNPMPPMSLRLILVVRRFLDMLPMYVV
eukprot:TRINITY_DN6682_c0_g1_i1.p2 TRINITY_DN6682_c0_g1~~TRINITY_DN6682_c0_g1_i1.p2  ORF type:complete len:111 (+),score=2.92 TRINITY_DN6682_c0_g1_i1:62-394(+)